MLRIVFLTQEGKPELTDDDRLAADALERRGARVEAIPWSRGGVGWSELDAVVVRSTWDYHLRPDEFALWLAARAADGTRLHNSAATIAWNRHKGYLLELERRGVAIVPTRLVRAGRADELAAALAGLPAAVVKPAVAASAHGAHRVDGGLAPRETLVLAAANDLLVQPFLPEIRDGEWSLIFFGGDFSHAVLKRPADGDFRVQTELGGATEAAVPDPTIVAAARAALAAAPDGPPLYARVDGVVVSGALRVMELELIEPHLFFSTNAAAPERFAEALLGDRPASFL